MEIVLWILVFVALIVCTRILTSELRISLEQRRRYAIKRRLQAFEYGVRIRQTAVAKRAACEMNMLAHHAYQEMLRAAIETERKAAGTPENTRRCK